VEALLFVTSSEGKFREAASIWKGPLERAALDLTEIQAATIADIARAKGKEAFARLHRPCVVEDAGLEFSAWGGLPGAYVKWFEHAGLEVLCRALDGFEDRGAFAVSVLCRADSSGETIVTGRVAGRIAGKPTGDGGFGWDAIFIPEGHDRTFAQMSATEKDAISHRRKAWEALAERIQPTRGERAGSGLPETKLS
jgi:non-canonical purine NTP pyrophosphatase (RdgB/HAM1 family)